MARTDRNNWSWLLVLIGAGKLLRAGLLVFFALKLHQLLDPDIGYRLRDFFHHIRMDPDNRLIHAMIARLTHLNPRQLHAIRLGSFIYAGLFTAEGLGLVLRRRWGEWLTVITTSLLLPVEGWELFHGHHHVVKIALMLLNALIVAYLARRLWKQRDRGAESPES